MRHRRVKAADFKSILRNSLLIFLCAVFVFSYTPMGKSFWDTACRTGGLTHFTHALPASQLHVHVIDVGKADAILIEGPQTDILVDCGTQEQAQTVLRYLSAREITHLDAVWISHGDRDHCGGLTQIAEEIEINALYQSPTATPVDCDTTAYEAQIGKIYRYPDFEIEVLGPKMEYDEENNNSLVFRLVYGEFSMLFCGDIEASAEENLLQSKEDLRADVLKVAHHGSNTSSSEAFLRAVEPQYAVISVGEDRNNLPRNVVLKRFADLGIPFFRTDKEGTVVVSTDGRNIQILTEYKAQ